MSVKRGTMHLERKILFNKKMLNFHFLPVVLAAEINFAVIGDYGGVAQYPYWTSSMGQS